MPAPNVVTVSPAPNAAGVVLGIPITVTFDSLVDHTTLSTATFAVTCPSTAQIVTPDQYLVSQPATVQGVQYVTGTYTATDALNASSVMVTTLTFTPSTPLQPNTVYTLLLLGADGAFTTATVKAADGSPLASSYQWVFTTGDLNLPTPPVQSPIPPPVIPLDPATITVSPINLVDNDLTQVITITFPAPLAASFDVSELLVGIDPILDDPNVVVPTGLTYAPVISSDRTKITITISGWPSS